VTQLDLIDRKHTALTFVLSKPGVFREDFHGWLDGNWHVYEAFELEANKVAARRDHYSSRTIIEVLRHETALRESTNELGLKINNNIAPDMARLWEMFHPLRKGFFEKRVSPLSYRAAA
jgi:hypothetical protein